MSDICNAIKFINISIQYTLNANKKVGSTPVQVFKNVLLLLLYKGRIEIDSVSMIKTTALHNFLNQGENSNPHGITKKEFSAHSP